MILKLKMKHQGEELYKVYINHDPGLTLTSFMARPTICIGENKGADQLRGNREADQRLCFRYSASTVPLLSNPKFQASSSFLCLYGLACVGPVRKPHC